MCKPTNLDSSPLRIVALATAPTKAAAPPGMKKNVSFNETVDVYVIDRLDAFAVRELFYRSEDYRLFRAESCMEILQAQADQSADPVVSIFRALFGLGNRRQQWSRQHQQRQQQILSRSCTVEVQRATPETVLRELAFAI